MSVWEQAAGEYFKHPTRWPNPFANMIKRIDVLACEDRLAARVEMYAIAAANLAWATFVPSPTEIFRKTLAGGYKCGFYGPIKYGSPLDLFWQDGRTSAVLGEIIRPATTALFYLWATETAFEALNTWTSLMLKIDLCDVTGAETIMAHGHAPIGLGPNHGAPAFWNIQYDPMNRGEAADGDVSALGRNTYKASWFGHVVSHSAQVRNLKIGWTINGVEGVNLVDFPDVNPGGDVAVEASVEGLTSPVSIQPYFQCDVPVTGVLGADIFGDKFYATIEASGEPDKPPRPQWPPSDRKPESMCPALLSYMRELTQ